MERVTICSVPVDVTTAKEALEICGGFLRDGRQHRVATVNPEFVVEAHKNKEFRSALAESDIAFTDGIGVALAARVLNGARVHRITGVDFMTALCGLAADEGVSVFFLGGMGGVAEKTATVMKKQFPLLKIIGWSEELDIEKFRNIDISIMFVALGAPKQEMWIAKNLATLPSVRIAMGVGGSFDLIAGKIKRAPRMLRKLGLEWLWRLGMEPTRIGRIWRATAVFPVLCIKEALSRRVR